MDAITLVREDHKLLRKLSKETAEASEAAARTKKLLQRVEIELKALEELGERMLAPKKMLLREVA